MRIFVSRPRTVVTCGAPERTSRHTGALFRGCDVWRWAAAAGEEFSGVGAGVGVCVCAYEALTENQSAATTSEATPTIEKRPINDWQSTIPDLTFRCRSRLLDVIPAAP
jgi:hypothetical protein